MADGEADAPGTDVGGADSRGYSLIYRSLQVAWGSDSYLMRSYAVVGGLVALFVTLLVVLALPTWILRSLGGGGTTTFSRPFLVVLGLFVVVPVLAPLAFARGRHRRDAASRRADFLLAASGYLFVASLYAALLISAPPGQREDPAGVLAPVVEFLYGLDPVLGVVPPVVAAVLVVAVERLV